MTSYMENLKPYAYKLVYPDGAYGFLIDTLGATIIQTEYE